MLSPGQINASTVDKKNQRLLGSLENAYIDTAQRHHGLAKICEVLHLEGPYISTETLSKAVRKLQHRHPTLRSRLQLNPRKPGSFLLEEDNTLELTIIEIERKRSDHETFWMKEWREREKATISVGDGVAQFWLLQDPEDEDDDNGAREIVFICEHGLCDAFSLSNAAHELLIALTNENDNLFAHSLNWPITMETALQRSFSTVNRLLSISKLIIQFLYMYMTTRSATAKIPLATVDFPIMEMGNYSHSQASYGILSKAETQELINKCRREGVTITSVVSSSILHAFSTVLEHKQTGRNVLQLGIAADPRRRYSPPIPNSEFSLHTSTMMPFVIPIRNIPKNCSEMWQLARSIRDHTQKCIDANQIFAMGMLIGKMASRAFDSINLENSPTCCVSSWGILPFREQYGAWKLVATTPILNMTHVFVPFIIIQTVNGVLTIMFGGNDPVIPSNVLDQLRDCTIKSLHEICED